MNTPATKFEIVELHIDTKYIGEKLPDMLAVFELPVSPYGNGIAVECQYRNEGKDRDATEQAYLDDGITTLWLEEDAFDLDSLDVNSDRGEGVPVWPGVVPEPSEWSGLAYDLWKRGNEHTIWMRAGNREPFDDYTFIVETTGRRRSTSIAGFVSVTNARFPLRGGFTLHERNMRSEPRYIHLVRFHSDRWVG